MLEWGMTALVPSPGCLVFDTALGFFAIAWSGHGLTRLVLPERSADAARARLGAQPAGLAPAIAEHALPVEIAGLVAAIRRYGEGEPADFASVPVDMTEVDDFRRDIYAAARRLAHGEAVTYGELAARAGHPGAARETGTALGRNPVPLVVPCHRIVAAGGRLGGFSAPGGATTKMRLLAHERARMPRRDAAQGVFAF